MLRIVARLSAIAVPTSRKSPRIETMSALSTATSAPVPMAMPTSAAASAGASFYAVANHCYALALGAQALDFGRFAAGQHFSEHIFDADLICNRASGGFVVAGYHPDLDAQTVEFGDCISAGFFYGVGRAEQHDKPAVDGDKHKCPARRRKPQCVGLCGGRVNPAFPHELERARKYLAAGNSRLYAPTGKGFEIFGGDKLKPALLGGVHYGARYRMLGAALGRCGKRKQFIFALVAIYSDVGQARFALGDGAGFVQHNGADRVEGLKRFATF